MAGSCVLRGALGWLGILGTLLGPLAYPQNSIKQIVVGNRDTCALLSDGQATCWGRSFLEMNAPPLFQRKDFVPVANSEFVTSITSGFDHACAILLSGKVECWGESRLQKLGSRVPLTEKASTYASYPSKPLLVPLPTSVKAVTVVTAQNASAALVANEPASGKPAFSIWQWGKLIEDDDKLPLDPTELQFGDRYPTQLVGGRNFFCVLLDSSEVSCWGGNAYGQLGVGDNLTRRAPRAGVNHTVADLGADAGKAEKLIAGYSHVCANFTKGGHKCWGGNYAGQLLIASNDGIGKTPAQLGNNLPYLTAAENGVPISEIQANGEQTCVIYVTGVARCWGKDYDNPDPSSEDEGAGFDAEREARLASVGPAVETNFLGRVMPFGPLSEVKQIIGGEEHACALMKSGRATCWGSNHGMQLGFDLEPYDPYLLGVRSTVFPQWIHIPGVNL